MTTAAHKLFALLHMRQPCTHIFPKTYNTHTSQLAPYPPPQQGCHVSKLPAAPSSYMQGCSPPLYIPCLYRSMSLSQPASMQHIAHVVVNKAGNACTPSHKSADTLLHSHFTPTRHTQPCQINPLAHGTNVQRTRKQHMISRHHTSCIPAQATRQHQQTECSPAT